MKKLKLIISYIIICYIYILPVGLSATPFSPVINYTNLCSDTVAKPIFKVGKTYTIKGISYTPALDNQYDEIGIASWYGGEFHGKLTSNGEVFNKDLVTAASTVLPLPSIVEVTNLDNGKKLLVRVNDRGPYASGRIIDVSERAAEILGFKNKGTARVRVALVPDLSYQVAKQMPNYEQVMETLYKSSVSKEQSNNCDTIQPSVYLPNVINASSTSVATKEHITSENSIQDELVNINSCNLKQVSLVEPTNIHKYIPRGVFVQVGAFDSNNTKIKEDINLLSKVGVVVLQNVDISGKNVLRVRVGPYSSIEDASKVKMSLIKLGYQDSRVVVEE